MVSKGKYASGKKNIYVHMLYLTNKNKWIYWKHKTLDNIIVGGKGGSTDLCTRNAIISSILGTIYTGNPKLVTITNPYRNGKRKACHH
jgi:hypothetical protein